jgi:hypothetical protein
LVTWRTRYFVRSLFSSRSFFHQAVVQVARYNWRIASVVPIPKPLLAQAQPRAGASTAAAADEDTTASPNFAYVLTKL